MKIKAYSIAILINVLFWGDIWFFDRKAYSGLFITIIIGTGLFLSSSSPKAAEIGKIATKSTASIFAVIVGLHIIAAVIAVAIHSLT